MKCYNCGHNEADHRFLVNMMGHGAEIFLCNECLEGFKQYAAYVMQNATPPTEEMAVREMGADSFPLDAGDDIKHRRKISALRARLREAVEREDYEQAAHLRDEIAKEEPKPQEEGVCVYDT